jgi:hypothetical protein
MRSWLAYTLLACVAALFLGCGLEPSEPAPFTVTTSGVIEFRNVEGGAWLIHADDGNGTFYNPRNLPDAFKVVGARVRVTLIERRDLVSIQPGIPADIVAISLTT